MGQTLSSATMIKIKIRSIEKYPIEITVIHPIVRGMPGLNTQSDNHLASISSSNTKDIHRLIQKLQPFNHQSCIQHNHPKKDNPTFFVWKDVYFICLARKVITPVVIITLLLITFHRNFSVIDLRHRIKIGSHIHWLRLSVSINAVKTLWWC